MVSGKKKSTNHRKDLAWRHSVQVNIESNDQAHVYLKYNYYKNIVKGSYNNERTSLLLVQKCCTLC